jgi:hypothetical protein
MVEQFLKYIAFPFDGVNIYNYPCAWSHLNYYFLELIRSNQMLG